MARDLIASCLLAAFGLGTIAFTQPTEPAQAQPVGADLAAKGANGKGAPPPVVARVRTRDGVIDLTVESVAEGGKAAHLRESVGQLIADAPAAPK